MAWSAAERLLQRGTWALLAMWALGLVSTLYLYVQPFFVAEVIRMGPDRLVWAEHGPDPRAFLRAAPLLVASLVLPIAWHRRALARLCRHTRAVVDPSQPGRYREAPGTVLRPAIPELAARAAVLRYAGRLAMALGLLLPVYFLAFSEGNPMVCFHCALPRELPRGVAYIPLLGLSTLLLAFHVPTRGRVLGKLARSWSGPGNEQLT
jgi:hypothetical protein